MSLTFCLSSSYAQPGVSFVNEQQGAAASDLFGSSIDCLTDRLIVGAPGARASGLNGVGGVAIFDVIAQSNLGTLQVPSNLLSMTRGADKFGGVVSSIDDVNGDMSPDVLISAPGAFNGRGVTLVYTATGLLPSVAQAGSVANENLGFDLESLGDIQGNSTIEYAAGAPNRPFSTAPAGAIQIIEADPNATSNIVIATVQSSVDFEEFGSALARVGDQNSDNRPELIVAAPGANNGMGRVYVYSTAISSMTLSSLHTFNGNTANQKLGAAVSDAGDADGDGRPEFAVGDPGADTGSINNHGAVYIYQYNGGTSCSLLATLLPSTLVSDYAFGIALPKNGCDFNRDLLPDLALGTLSDQNGTNAGSVVVFRANSLPTPTPSPSPIPDPNATPAPTPEVPTLKFRISRRGVLAGAVEYQTTPTASNGNCEARLEGIIAIGRKKLTKIGLIGSGEITRERTLFAADRLPLLNLSRWQEASSASKSHYTLRRTR